MGGEKVNLNYYRNDSWVDNTFSKRGKWVLSLLLVVFSVGIIAGGCGVLQNFGADKSEPEAVAPVEPVANVATPVKKEEVKVPTDGNVDVDVDSNQASAMVAYDVTSIGRSDPFMPIGEIQAFEDAKNSAIEEANAYNSRIKELEKLKDVVVRQPDDISPYSFNLPVPPTSLASCRCRSSKNYKNKSCWYYV